MSGLSPDEAARTLGRSARGDRRQARSEIIVNAGPAVKRPRRKRANLAMYERNRLEMLVRRHGARATVAAIKAVERHRNRRTNLKPLSKERALEVECTRRKTQEREKLRQEKQREQKELQQKVLQQEHHQPVNAARRASDHWRLAILKERDQRRAWGLFTKLFGVKIQDRAILKRVEELVERAIGAGDGHIEMPTDLVEVIAILLKKVPAHDETFLPKEKRIRERVIYDLARQDVSRLIDEKRLSREEATSKVIRQIRRDPTERAAVGLPPEELKKVLGKDYTTKHIKDRLQRRKPRTGK
jgi:hypothetical protein